jgi:signal peptide peptidase SppA
MRFPHLAQRLFNVPLAIHPQKAEIVMAALADRLGIAHLFRADGLEVALARHALAFDPDERRDRAASAERGYDVVAGVAVVPIEGTLVQKLGTLRPSSGMTGYDGIRQNLLTALADPQVRALLLDIDSPGGEVAGCFDLADTIFACRGDKPIWAVLDESAYSAAYALASAADRVVVPRTGGTGSIGVMALRIDFTKALAADGIKVAIVASGARKADGHPAKALSGEELDAIQRDVDASAAIFFDTVARHRALAANAVRALQAATFQGAAGVAAGLADDVLPPDAAFRALLDTL